MPGDSHRRHPAHVERPPDPRTPTSTPRVLIPTTSKLAVRTIVLETDPYGNFLTQGYELASARDWARLGNLYLQDGGVWNGERLLR